MSDVYSFIPEAHLELRLRMQSYEGAVHYAHPHMLSVEEPQHSMGQGANIAKESKELAASESSSDSAPESCTVRATVRDNRKHAESHVNRSQPRKVCHPFIQLFSLKDLQNGVYDIAIESRNPVNGKSSVVFKWLP